MQDVKTYIQSLFTAKGIVVSSNKSSLFEEFIVQQDSIDAVQRIIENQNSLMDKWKIKNRIADILSQQIVIPARS